jgi:two-component system chemotaxis response regulator CheY
MPEYIRPKENILIVEDDRIAQRFLQKFLKEIGDVGIAETGKQGIEMYAQALIDDRYSMVCLDIDLPDISGNEVLCAIRDLEKEHGLLKEERSIVLITTAESGMKNVLQAMNHGCDGYIIKPFSREQLFVELNRIGVEFSWQ